MQFSGQLSIRTKYRISARQTSTAPRTAQSRRNFTTVIANKKAGPEGPIPPRFS
jgi:hypothetical protein